MRLRLPQNVACGFPALGSSEVDSQFGEGLQLRVREVELRLSSGNCDLIRWNCSQGTAPCQLRLLSILRQ